MNARFENYKIDLWKIVKITVKKKNPPNRA